MTSTPCSSIGMTTIPNTPILPTVMTSVSNTAIPPNVVTSVVNPSCVNIAGQFKYIILIGNEGTVTLKS